MISNKKKLKIIHTISLIINKKDKNGRLYAATEG